MMNATPFVLFFYVLVIGEINDAFAMKENKAINEDPGNYQDMFNEDPGNYQDVFNDSKSQYVSTKALPVSAQRSLHGIALALVFTTPTGDNIQAEVENAGKKNPMWDVKSREENYVDSMLFLRVKPIGTEDMKILQTTECVSYEQENKIRARSDNLMCQDTHLTKCKKICEKLKNLFETTTQELADEDDRREEHEKSDEGAVAALFGVDHRKDGGIISNEEAREKRHYLFNGKLSANFYTSDNPLRMLLAMTDDDVVEMVHLWRMIKDSKEETLPLFHYFRDDMISILFLAFNADWFQAKDCLIFGKCLDGLSHSWNDNTGLLLMGALVVLRDQIYKRIQQPAVAAVKQELQRMLFEINEGRLKFAYAEEVEQICLAYVADVAKAKAANAVNDLRNPNDIYDLPPPPSPPRKKLTLARHLSSKVEELSSRNLGVESSPEISLQLLTSVLSKKQITNEDCANVKMQWQKKTLAKLKKEIENFDKDKESQVKYKDSAGAGSVTSDVDIPTSGKNTELGVIAFSKTFRKMFNTQKDSGTVLDLNTYASGFVLGAQFFAVSEDGETETLITSDKLSKMKGKIIIRAKQYAPDIQLLKESTLLLDDEQSLEALAHLYRYMPHAKDAELDDSQPAEHSEPHNFWKKYSNFDQYIQGDTQRDAQLRGQVELIRDQKPISPIEFKTFFHQNINEKAQMNEAKPYKQPVVSLGSTLGENCEHGQHIGNKFDKGAKIWIAVEEQITNKEVELRNEVFPRQELNNYEKKALRMRASNFLYETSLIQDKLFKMEMEEKKEEYKEHYENARGVPDFYTGEQLKLKEDERAELERIKRRAIRQGSESLHFANEVYGTMDCTNHAVVLTQIRGKLNKNREGLASIEPQMRAQGWNQAITGNFGDAWKEYEHYSDASYQNLLGYGAFKMGKYVNRMLQAIEGFLHNCDDCEKNEEHFGVHPYEIARAAVATLKESQAYCLVKILADEHVEYKSGDKSGKNPAIIQKESEIFKIFPENKEAFDDLAKYLFEVGFNFRIIFEQYEIRLHGLKSMELLEKEKSSQTLSVGRSLSPEQKSLSLQPPEKDA